MTGLFAGENRVNINGRPNFWLDGNPSPTASHNCNNRPAWTESVSFQNGQSLGHCQDGAWIDEIYGCDGNA